MATFVFTHRLRFCVGELVFAGPRFPVVDSCCLFCEFTKCRKCIVIILVEQGEFCGLIWKITSAVVPAKGFPGSAALSG